MKNEYRAPFLEGANRRCGAFRLQFMVYEKLNSSLLAYMMFCLCLPWVSLFFLYENIVGTINVSRIKPYSNPKYKLAIVAIAKNESEYIAEWIAFHIANGIEHFYLYDNDSTDTMPDIIKKFAEKGYVTYNQIHGERQQGNAYNDAFKRYGRECKYMAVIDCDEYLQTVDPAKNIVDEVDRIIGDNKSIGGVVVNWVMYGSSHYDTKPEGMCFEKFIMRANPGQKGTDVIKTIVRPECVKSFSHPHTPEYYIGFYSVNTLGERRDFWCNPINEYVSLRLNHYFTKSKEQWIVRRAARRADTGTARPLDEFYEHDHNDIVDNSALIYKKKVDDIIEAVLG